MASGSLLLLVVAIAAAGRVHSQPPPPLSVANIYGDHMVLQQAPEKAIVWGYATKCDSKITATFNGMTYPTDTSTDKSGQCVWILTLPATVGDAKKAYNITVTSDMYGSITLRDVLFGDVWMCGGQSNMVFNVAGVYNATDEIKDADHYPQIRIFTADRITSNTPQTELLGILQPWASVNSTNIGAFSAVCWFFGRDLYEKVQYPIGLISSNWGGTPVEAWSSPDALKMCKKGLKATPVNETVGKEKVGGPGEPSVLWNAMIHPFLNMTVKGAIWYQGEANSHTNPELYSCTFPSMIDDWRAKWSASTKNQTSPLYFGFVQLAPDGNSNVTVGGFPVIRWAQTANYGYVPNKRMQNVFMAVAIDLGDPDSPHGSIHPRDKQDVGTRLTIGARHVVYNDLDVLYLGMLPQSAKLSTSNAGVTAVAISFGPPSDQTKLELRYPYGFEISCEDQPAGQQPPVWLEGTAKSISGNDVMVEFPLCQNGLKPMQVRYCWRTDPCTFSKCPVYSGANYPSPPFIMKLT